MPNVSFTQTVKLVLKLCFFHLSLRHVSFASLDLARGFPLDNAVRDYFQTLTKEWRVHIHRYMRLLTSLIVSALKGKGMIVLTPASLPIDHNGNDHKVKPISKQNHA